MHTAKDLFKKPIYSVTDGTKLGEIKDIYLDGDTSTITAVLVGKEGVFTKRMLVIRRSDVRTIGVDCWLTHGEAEVMDLKEVDGFEDFQLITDLRKREMETVGGTKIGTVGDVLFDDDDSVVGFALARVHVQGPVAEAKQVVLSAVTEFGDKKTAMMVDLEAAERAANESA